MRSQCDAFLQRLEVKMLSHVSQVINTVKSEMYLEITKTVGAMVSKINSQPAVVNASSSKQSKEAETCLDIPMDSSEVSDAHSDFILPRKYRKSSRSVKNVVVIHVRKILVLWIVQ